jgi:hypothetical protein
MRPSAFLSVVVAAIKARKPLLVVSDPGVGKTSLVRSAVELAATATDTTSNLIVSHPVVADPTDAKGLPWISADKKSATFLPFGDLAQALNATTPCVWFLDDLGQASPAVQASYMQLLLSRRMNGHVLPDVVTFVAATNRRAAGMGVSGMLEPVKSRFSTIVELEAHIGDWATWATLAEIHPTVVAYLRWDSTMLHKPEPSSDMVNHPSPRTWENFSEILGWGLSPENEREAGAGAIGVAAAGQYFAFAQQYALLPHADEIISDPETFKIKDTRPEVLYVICGALARKADAANLASICRFAERLETFERGEFAALLIHDTMRRTPSLMATPEYASIKTGPLGNLLSGSTINA